MKSSEILVIANDAGGAEIISSYVKKNSDKKTFICYVAGPAKKVFRRNQLKAHPISDDKKAISRVIHEHASAAMALLGTGWMTTIESSALEEAKSIGLKTAVYLESWVNFRERFGYPRAGWRERLPDEIWVGDKYAFKLAKKFFPSTQVRLVRNQYFLNIKRRYSALKKTRGNDKILFLSDAVGGMESVLSDVFAMLVRKEDGGGVRIRLHPADTPTRYDRLISLYRKRFPIVISKERDLVRDLLHARVVIGTETVAMVGAVLVGIRTISIAQKGVKPQLPYSEIIRIKNAAALRNLI